MAAKNALPYKEKALQTATCGRCDRGMNSYTLLSYTPWVVFL